MSDEASLKGHGFFLDRSSDTQFFIQRFMHGCFFIPRINADYALKDFYLPAKAFSTAKTFDLRSINFEHNNLILFDTICKISLNSCNRKSSLGKQPGNSKTNSEEIRENVTYWYTCDNLRILLKLRKAV